MKILAITQARIGSTRLPHKVLKKINGETLLGIHINRILKSSMINSLFIATTTKKEDDIIQKEAIRLNVNCFRGSENDVLDRYYNAVKKVKPDYIVRLTSDCPLIDASLIDKVIKVALISKVDYCSNTLIESFPDGQDVEVFTFDSLKLAWKEAHLVSEREHVTPYIKKNSDFYNKKKFKVKNVISNNIEYKNVRMTVDELQDFNVIKMLIDELGFEDNWKNYAKLYLSKPSISENNIHIIRNEGYLKSIKNES